MNELRDLIQHALDQDYNKASEVFGNIMSVKMSDVLDQEKVKVAAQIYNDGNEMASDDLDDIDDIDDTNVEIDAEDEEDLAAIDAMTDEEIEDGIDDIGDDDDEIEEDPEI